MVFNANADADLDKAGFEPAKAFMSNRDVPNKLAKIAAENEQKLFHISTDYVFGGIKESPYLKTLTPHPINVYGQSKLAGEVEALRQEP